MAWGRLLTLGLLSSLALLLGCGASPAASTRTSSAGPAQLAATINRAQVTIDDAASSAAELQTAARAQQLAFRELAGSRAVRRSVLARLSPSARSAAAAALRAGDALARILPRERRFPDWRIVAPRPARELVGDFRAAGAKYRIPWQYLAAIELVETRMGRIHGLSPAGAKGPMQFMPATWAEYGHGSIDNQRNAVMAAARFLAANGGNRKIADALFHYNPSQSYAIAVESYAREMRADRRAFYAYYYWQVFYRTTRGTYLLPVGYPRVRPVRLSG